MPPTMRGPCAEHAHTFYAGPSLIRGEGFADLFKRFLRSFVASPRRVTKQALLGGCLILDNTPSIASIIPDDADDAMHAGDAKQGVEGKCKEAGVTGSEQNESQRMGTKNGEGTEEKPRCRKMQGQNVKWTGQNANKGVFKEMEGAETAVKWK